MIADAGNNKIRRYDPATGAVITLAGTGAGDFMDGDGLTARFNRPSGIEVMLDGSPVIADASTRLRRLAYK